MEYLAFGSTLWRLLGGVFVSVAAAVLVATSAQAATMKQQLTIAPALAEVSVRPGGTATGEIMVGNKGSEPFTLRVYTAPYSVSGPDYTATFQQLPGTTRPDEWVTVTYDNAVLEPTRVRHVTYVVQVPEGTPPGGYYAVVFVQSSPVIQSTDDVTTHNRAGQILYMTVEGAVIQEGSVSAATLGFFSWGSAVDVSTSVKNTGGVHFRATSLAEVYDMFGRRVWGQETERYVLPQTERRFPAVWQNGSFFGIYKVARQVELLGRTDRLPDQWLVVAHPAIVVGVGIGLAALVFRVVSARIRSKKH